MEGVIILNEATRLNFLGGFFVVCVVLTAALFFSALARGNEMWYINLICMLVCMAMLFINAGSNRIYKTTYDVYVNPEVVNMTEFLNTYHVLDAEDNFFKVEIID